MPIVACNLLAKSLNSVVIAVVAPLGTDPGTAVWRVDALDAGPECSMPEAQLVRTIETPIASAMAGLIRLMLRVRII
jgi:hypothetical protein